MNGHAMATTPREITVLLRLNPAPFIAAVTAVRQAAERFNALMASHPSPRAVPDAAVTPGRTPRAPRPPPRHPQPAATAGGRRERVVGEAAHPILPRRSTMVRS
jgi:hypothetical protein